MIDISQQPLTEEMRKQVYDGFSRHAIATIGVDEKIERTGFLHETSFHYMKKDFLKDERS